MTALLRRVVTVDWPSGVERDAKALLIRTARTGHQKIMGDAARQGNPPSWEAYANTPGNKDLASVKLPGPIVYNYRYLTDVIQFALDELRRQSPVQSGDYVRSHTLFINGSPVDVIPKVFKAGDKIMIANPIAYARKIEVGKTKDGRAFVVQVEPRIYQRVADLVAARAKGSARVRSAFVTLSAGSLKNNQATRSFASGRLRVSSLQRKDRVAGSAITSPAIIIESLI